MRVCVTVRDVAPDQRDDRTNGSWATGRESAERRAVGEDDGDDEENAVADREDSERAG